MQSPAEIAEPHALEGAALAARLSVDPARGLEEAEAAARLARHGPNLLSRRRRRSALAILADQLKSLIVWLLAAAAALALATGDLPEAVAIGVVLALNTAIGFFTEWRAIRSMEALQRIARVATRVRRGGLPRMVPAETLVPGDVVVLEAGDVVTADLRLLEAAALEADESVLTGESLPVRKTVGPVAPDTPVADRAGMLFKGAAITRGAGLGIVAATGMTTELGRISALTEAAVATASPIERRLEQLGTRLVWLTLALAALTALAGILQGRDIAEMVETGIALAVAAVPEGLPVVATLSLARGVWRMARMNAILTDISAVETLGATTLIITDKTGTLTENRMTLECLLLAGRELAPEEAGRDPAGRAALEVAALCNNAELAGVGAEDTGDPMELALLRGAAEAGIARPELLRRWPEIREHAFDPDRRMMATVHRDAGGALLVAVKGAPEPVLEAAAKVLDAAGQEVALDAGTRAEAIARVEAMAARGYRLLGLARKTGTSDAEDPYAGLTLLGFAGLQDPLRDDVPAALADCGRAGVRVVMATGDHAATAAEIARAAGITGPDGRLAVLTGAEIGDAAAAGAAGTARLREADVLARVSPEAKLELVRRHQAAGEIVAMTGDGVNDAPALRQADIGVAMGQRGTEVARQAARMVLKDDAFPTIVVAMREGRIIFDNIRSFVIYLMSCNFSEMLIVGLAVGAGLPVPLLPLQILFLNLVTDVFPAFALGLGRGRADVMDRPPRDPAEPIAAGRHWGMIAALGGLITLVTLSAYFWAHRAAHLDTGQAVTVAFVTLALAQLWNVFNMRRARGGGPLRNEVTRNGWVWAALGLCLALTAAALWLPPLATALNLPDPGPEALLAALAASLVPVLAWQSWLWLWTRLRDRRGRPRARRRGD